MKMTGFFFVFGKGISHLFLQGEWGGKITRVTINEYSFLVWLWCQVLQVESCKIRNFQLATPGTLPLIGYLLMKCFSIIAMFL